jgi:hypothetical protein
MGRLIGILVVVWLVIGVFAAYQRGYLTNDSNVKCKTVGDSVVTVIAGPLNYLGANPKVSCHIKAPQPSK